MGRHPAPAGAKERSAAVNSSRASFCRPSGVSHVYLATPGLRLGLKSFAPSVLSHYCVEVSEQLCELFPCSSGRRLCKGQGEVRFQGSADKCDCPKRVFRQRRLEILLLLSGRKLPRSFDAVLCPENPLRATLHRRAVKLARPVCEEGEGRSLHGAPFLCEARKKSIDPALA